MKKSEVLIGLLESETYDEFVKVLQTNLQKNMPEIGIKRSNGDTYESFYTKGSIVEDEKKKENEKFMQVHMSFNTPRSIEIKWSKSIGPVPIQFHEKINHVNVISSGATDWYYYYNITGNRAPISGVSFLSMYNSLFKFIETIGDKI